MLPLSGQQVFPCTNRILITDCQPGAYYSGWAVCPGSAFVLLSSSGVCVGEHMKVCLCVHVCISAADMCVQVEQKVIIQYFTQIAKLFF